MDNKISTNKIIADIKATKGNRSGCQGLSSSLESDGYITSICKLVRATSPDRINALVEHVEKQDAALIAWEKTMMEVCGEDGPASVASEIRSLRALRDTAIQALKSQVEQLAAENVGLKAGVTYFAYSPEYGFDYFKDKQNAIDTAQEEIDAYREDADDGWSEDVQRVSWGVVIQQAQGFDAQGLHTSDSQHTYQTCNYRLVDSVATPATDRIVAEAEARGVEKAIECIVQTITPNHETILKEFAQQLREGAE